MSEILVLASHPDLARSRVTRALLQRLRPLAASRPELLALRELYRLYPDFVIDSTAEREALAAARLIVWLHPLHWYSMPALMKLWLDEVLALGWAYGPAGTALQGKDLWLVCSTGGTAESYTAAGHNGHAIEHFLLPQLQTARLCGMRFLPPLLLHGAHQLGEVDLDQHALLLEQRLLSHPQWCADLPALACPALPATARPDQTPPGASQ
ncbi:NAD(P)H-dependent oxidoreductase [Paucibacter sp. APW11]|uniref:NAD(P)H-dependent oxidoreductase n=1 Tax=Roseateles aquae TaxID=3077235 RepID=A0ABU3P9S4_9BURK|nr:NAD(P)H-dependent oxidoreductase [Paucibacter sp. APW11]MDT8999299.1 NAD(P)H-dependent oxidoreductase [Paucibacter sp. APW11]